MQQISLFVPKSYIEWLDKLVGKGHYPNRAEAIRIAVRDLLNSEMELTRRFK